MTWPKPEPGLVIRYSYLWADEFDAGRDEGSKDRPCAIIVSLVEDNGELWITVLPVTHSQPRNPSDAVEIPAETKRRLGLDGDQSWIVLTERNEFRWPGPDLRPLRPGVPNSVSYGYLPRGLLKSIRSRILAREQDQSYRPIQRTE